MAEIEEKLKSEVIARGEANSKLENSLDGQFKALQGQIRKEEISRAQQELVLKSDITKLAEQLRMDYELFKSQQNQLTEKITEMIKLEVDTRLACDRENRTLNEVAIKKIVEEITAFKEAVEKQNKRFAKDMKEANTENSERANFLSRYIDDQIKKLDEQVDDQLKKIKILCAKLTEQVKEHFQNEEIALSEMKTTVAKTSEDLITKMNSVKENCDISITDLSTEIIMKKVIDNVESSKINSEISRIDNITSQKISGLEKLASELQKMCEAGSEECKKRYDKQLETSKEEMERKIQALLEKLKNENQSQWLKSVEMVEKIVSPEGTKNLLKMAPPTVLKMDDIKSALAQASNSSPSKIKPKIVTGPTQASNIPPVEKPVEDPKNEPGKLSGKSPRPEEQPKEENKKPDEKMNGSGIVGGEEKKQEDLSKNMDDDLAGAMDDQELK